MKKALLILPLVFLFSAAQSQTRILWLGNSYTGVNNLPSLFYNLALEIGDTVIYDSNTPGGYTFNGHSTNGTTLNKISSQPWDFVMLQEQSQIPSFSPGQVANDCYPYAQVLIDSIRSNDPCTEPVFYMTWGRKYGDQNNCAVWPPVCAYEGMQWQLRRSYMELSQIHDCTVAPAGSAWWRSIMGDSTLNLYTGDNSHPNIYGSYLTALTFFATVYRQSPVGLSYVPSGITPSEAAYLQGVAELVVLDSLEQWNIGHQDIIADFNWNTTNASVQFTDQSQNGTSYAWDFGDGNTSTDVNPNHTYASNGTYPVTLIINGACGSDTVSYSVDILSTSIPEAKPMGDLRLYPNPVGNSLSIRHDSKALTGASLSILDLAGREIKLPEVQTGNFKSSLEVVDLPAGVYVLRITNGSETRQLRFVKR